MSSKSSYNSLADGPRLAVQEQLVPGSSLQEKFELLTTLGYQGIEVRSKGGFAFRERLSELKGAVRDGVVVSSACIEMTHFIGDFDAERRRDARDNLKSQLEVIAEVGGDGVVTPASYGMFSTRLPPYEPPRAPEEDQQVLVEALSELGQVAKAIGVHVFLEPLNRYEDHMLNTVEQGAALIKASGGVGIKLCCDFYHMNIEEDDPARSLIDNSRDIGHVHVSDSNRNEPGTGHVDWLSGMGALVANHYSSWMVLECRPRSDLRSALVRCQQTVTRALRAVQPPAPHR